MTAIEPSDLLVEYAKQLYYGNSTGVQGNYPKAYAFFKLAAEQGNVESQFYLGLLTFFQLDGSFVMQTNFDRLYKNKHNFLKDYVKKANVTKAALHLYIASIQGNLKASFVLGNFYREGVVMKKKCPSAALYLKKVADDYFSEENWENNYTPRLVEKRRLDKEYFDTREANKQQKDLELEIEFMKMAADLGQVNYMKKLAKIYLYGTMGQERNYKLALEYYLRAADLGDVVSKTDAGTMYIRGLGTEKDYEKALKLLNEAALRNDPRAKNALGKKNLSCFLY